MLLLIHSWFVLVPLSPCINSIIWNGLKPARNNFFYFDKALCCLFYYLSCYIWWNISSESTFDNLSTWTFVWVIWIWDQFKPCNRYFHSYDAFCCWHVIFGIIIQNTAYHSIWIVITQNILIYISRCNSGHSSCSLVTFYEISSYLFN